MIESNAANTNNDELKQTKDHPRTEPEAVVQSKSQRSIFNSGEDIQRAMLEASTLNANLTLESRSEEAKRRNSDTSKETRHPDSLMHDSNSETEKTIPSNVPHNIQIPSSITLDNSSPSTSSALNGYMRKKAGARSSSDRKKKVSQQTEQPMLVMFKQLVKTIVAYNLK